VPDGGAKERAVKGGAWLAAALLAALALGCVKPPPPPVGTVVRSVAMGEHELLLERCELAWIRGRLVLDGCRTEPRPLPARCPESGEVGAALRR
jgi:hypothetical protein